MNRNYIKLEQFGLEMYMVSLTIEDLIEHYKIDLYDPKTDDGYQRPPIPPHFRNIGKYLKKENPILPSAILAAVSEDQIKELSENLLEINGKIRIVDGQHRIEGFKYLNKIDENRFMEMRNFQFPVIILKINENQRLHEINTFIDINSKGKKVSTDLAIRLRDKNRNENAEFLNEHSQVIESIATNVTLELNNSLKSPQWLHSIKTSPNEYNNIISINAFNTSLFPLIKSILKDKEIKSIDDIKELSTMIFNLLVESWNVIYKKWSNCFTDTQGFKKEYNLQKGIGVHSLHLVLNNCYINANYSLNKTLENFIGIIDESPATYQDWISGGKLSGYNSASGFSKIAKYIETGELKE
ncbi:hypothetical protein CN378_17945 [Bacillus sp. AFS015802]|uniref:DGQHR domain-containing protein n=1 Tax=Bacillus sp. AFS015802 TaxID=2033486 RepID=UPI000BF4719F|nr:DGQHR domain-containing protein [Bacillus sp. AFS015802]PFA62923.1 hypothetical protein CN378_17945 [Bacillus sp. AFS015802]